MASFPLLVFDLDGTLVDALPDLTAALNRMLAARGLAPLMPAEVRPMVGDGTRKLLERAFAARGAAFDAASEAAFLADYTAHVADATRPFPGVEATLARLRDEGWHFAICTNKSTAATKALLNALGLAHWFAALGCGDTFAARKPDPAHLGGTVALADGSRERSIMVGDHANDIAAGTALGLPTVFAAWGYGDRKMAAGASTVAERFSELAKLAPTLIS
ncbi:MAG TPA: HAD-IA family hydrolase [Stellaceae bacterium]|jgi:phosphoglycolate phosphatase